VKFSVRANATKYLTCCISMSSLQAIDLLAITR